ncbi:MAG: GtrA family protein [Acidobacteria bacterium]|nr:GtrA family protein [Acidobacteriota bacterium]
MLAPRVGRGRAFLLVGAGGLAVQVAALWGLTEFAHVHYVAGLLAAIELAIAHNFWWHRRWTWRDRVPGRPALQVFGAFNLAAATGAGLTLGATVLLVEAVGLPPLAASVVGVGAGALATFSLSDRYVFAVLLVLAAAPPGAGAATLEPQATAAFDRYVRATEARVEAERQGTRPFLWLETLAARDAREARAALQRGDVHMTRVGTPEHDGPLPVPGGLVHHWVATIHVPGAAPAEIARTMQAYERYPEIHHPAVTRATVRAHTGETWQVRLQLAMTKVLTAVVNADYDVRYRTLGPGRMQVASVGTRFAEVDGAGTAGETERPVGRDRGFLWRHNSYCAIEARDHGSDVQCETVSLSRRVPAGLGWLVGPFVSSVPKEALEQSLRALRTAVVSRRSETPP